MMTAVQPTWNPAEIANASWKRRGKDYHDAPTMAVFIVAHMVLALAMHQVRVLATVHALAVLALGISFAVRRKGHEKAVYVLAYISTSDVIWRMSRAGVFWEYGKYAMVVVLLVLLARGRRHPGLATLAGLYWLMLMPSVVLTVTALGFGGQLRRDLSFNLSGPLVLAVAVIYFSGYAERRFSIAKVLAWAIYPVVGCFTIASYSTLTALQLNFGDFANMVTSGGFGPNQVSSILGLGVFFCLVLAIKVPDPWLRVLTIGTAAALSTQAVLTFSRGGVLNVVVAMSFFGFHSLTSPRVRRNFFAVLVAGGLVGTFLLFPRLNDWTKGMVSQRFTSFDTTGRQSLAEADLRLFLDNPALGVGPGQARYQRVSGLSRSVASHTEFTRLLAEHGAMGLTALILIVIMAIRAYQLAPSLLAKGWVSSFAAWTLANMAHSGMRLVAMSFVFGIAMLPFHQWRRMRGDQGTEPEGA